MTLRPLTMERVDVAHGDDIAETRMLFGVSHAHAARADTTDTGPVVFGNVRRCLRSDKVRDKSGGASRL